MKILATAAPSPNVQEQTATATLSAGQKGPGELSSPPDQRGALTGDAARDFRKVYDGWFNEVSRWIRALGGPEADRDDIVQEVFLVVRRRLPFFDGRNVAGWLYRITRRKVRDFRRRTWVKHLFSPQHLVNPEDLPHLQRSPAEDFELEEDRRVLRKILDRMQDDRRLTFMLFEIEGRSGEEIAQIQEIPVNTVWTRLHHARKEFFALATKYQNVQRQKGETI